jgi:predicted transcriptional regulator
VATLNVIRRWALRDQMSIREISRRTGLARNTVKKHLRSEESEPKYPRRVSSTKLDPYAEKLTTWLGIEATKSRKQRRTLRQIHTGMVPRALRSPPSSKDIEVDDCGCSWHQLAHGEFIVRCGLGIERGVALTNLPKDPRHCQRTCNLRPKSA